jgi:hypothetical protein
MSIKRSGRESEEGLQQLFGADEKEGKKAKESSVEVVVKVDSAVRDGGSAKSKEIAKEQSNAKHGGGEGVIAVCELDGSKGVANPKAVVSSGDVKAKSVAPSREEGIASGGSGAFGDVHDAPLAKKNSGPSVMRTMEGVAKGDLVFDGVNLLRKNLSEMSAIEMVRLLACFVPKFCEFDFDKVVLEYEVDGKFWLDNCKPSLFAAFIIELFPGINFLVARRFFLIIQGKICGQGNLEEEGAMFGDDSIEDEVVLE